jgi:hypothetical protein
VGVPARSGDLRSPFHPSAHKNVGADADAEGQRPTPQLSGITDIMKQRLRSLDMLCARWL